MLSKVIFDRMRAGQIFRVITEWTGYEIVPVVLAPERKYVCVKGRSGIDWCIYGADDPTATSIHISRYGDKVTSEKDIRWICPCDDEVFALYRF